MWLRLFYRLLLWAYPASFRQDAGAEATRVFVDACRESWRTDGLPSLLGRVGLALVDVPRQGLAERAAIRRARGANTRRPLLRVPSLGADLGRDVVYGARSLRRSPAFTFAAILTMTIGIGLSTAAFTVFNAVGLRGWPVEHARDLVILQRADERSGFDLDDFYRIRQESRSLMAVAATRSAFQAASLTPTGPRGGGYGQFVTSGFFSATGVRLILGRDFEPTDDAEGAPNVVIISHGLWQQLFDGAAGVIGRSMFVGNIAHTVVGVTREGWRGGQPYRDDFWLPLRELRQFRPADPLVSGSDAACCVQLLGRLAPGFSHSQAAAELTTLGRRGGGDRHRPSFQVQVSGTSMAARAPASMRLAAHGLMLVATIMILLLTGANIAHLQLARSMARAKEIQTRLALGAGRARVTRQLITEALLLTAAAGALSLVLVHALVDTLMHISEVELREVWTPDFLVYGYCLAVSLAMTVTFSLLPALRATRGGATFGAGRAATPQRLRFNLVLLTTQIALSASLLTGGALLTRAMSVATRGHAGFALADITVLTYEPTGPASTDRSAARAFRLVLDAAIAASPVPVAMMDVLPFSEVMTATAVPSGHGATSPQSVDLFPMSGSTFAVLGVPLSAGRPHVDDPEAGEGVINETAARRLWPDSQALGQTLQVGGEAFTIVGISRDVHLGSRERIRPTLHMAAGSRRVHPALVARGDGYRIADQLRTIVTSLDGGARVTVGPLSDRIAARLTDERAGAQAAWAGGLLALALATFGVFGVFAYVVEDRRREIGIRLALGAQPRQLLNSLFRPARVAVTSGLGLGLVLSLAAKPLLESLGIRLFGLSPVDPVAFGTVAVILALAALLATWVPARRALSLDPAVTLRADL